MCCEHIVAQKNYLGKFHAGRAFSVFFSAVIKALNAHIVKSFYFRFLPIKLPVAVLCAAVWAFLVNGRNKLHPYRNRPCVKAVWPVCGNFKTATQRSACNLERKTVRILWRNHFLRVFAKNYLEKFTDVV